MLVVNTFDKSTVRILQDNCQLACILDHIPGNSHLQGNRWRETVLIGTLEVFRSSMRNASGKSVPGLSGIHSPVC